MPPFRAVKIKSLFTCTILSLLLILVFQVSNLDAAMAASSEEGSGSHDFHRLTYDVGIASGSYNNYNYTEFNFGLNFFFEKWLAWRNAAFARMASGISNTYGLDSSVRGILDVGGSALGLTSFAGVGARFSNQSSAAPLIEAGLVVHLIGIHLGLGAKEIFNSSTNSGTPNDTQYFLIFGGGGAF